MAIMIFKSTTQTHNWNAVFHALIYMKHAFVIHKKFQIKREAKEKKS